MNQSLEHQIRKLLFVFFRIPPPLTFLFETDPKTICMEMVRYHNSAHSTGNVNPALPDNAL